MRDDFPLEVKRTLAARVGNLCSNPDCRALTSGPQDDPAKALNVGVAAHITGAAPGGSRYDPSLSREQRCHADNGVWLCQTCAKLVDNDPEQFPTQLLRAWRTLAEHRARSSIGKTLPAPIESEARRKTRVILEWKDKIVTHSVMSPPEAALRIGLKMSSTPVYIRDCTEDYVRVGPVGFLDSVRSIPLGKVVICYDDANKRLELQEQLA
jgi:hypothetical protein